MAEYGFITLDDGTQLSHSEMLADHRVKVYLRRDKLHHALFLLPEQTWADAMGFSEEDLLRYQKLIRKMTPLILEFSQKGGFRGASGLED